MIRVTVELVSAVNPSRNRLLGVAKIVNDGAGSETHGNYRVELSKAGRAVSQVWRHGYVEGFPRKNRGGWDLLFLALRSCVGSRNQADHGLNATIGGIPDLPTIEQAMEQLKASADALASGSGTSADRALLVFGLELSRLIERRTASEPAAEAIP